MTSLKGSNINENIICGLVLSIQLMFGSELFPRNLLFSVSRVEVLDCHNFPFCYTFEHAPITRVQNDYLNIEK